MAQRKGPQTRFEGKTVSLLQKGEKDRKKRKKKKKKKKRKEKKTKKKNELMERETKGATPLCGFRKKFADLQFVFSIIYKVILYFPMFSIMHPSAKVTLLSYLTQLEAC